MDLDTSAACEAPASAAEIGPAVEPDIRVGFVLAPCFTLLAFAGLIEALRHAADEADRSRQVYCRWSIVGAESTPVQASCGVEIGPVEPLGDPRRFDYVVIVGGLTSAFPKHHPAISAYLRSARNAGVPVVGLCTGTMVMAQAGLLDGRRCAVHWRHEHEMRANYPLVRPVVGEPFVIDGALITCPGGVASIQLAIALIRRHCGQTRALKSLAQMCVDPDHARLSTLPDLFAEVARYGDRRVERAVDLMRECIAEPYTIEEISSRLGTSVRQLDRAFQRHAHMSPAQFWRRMRLEHGRERLANSNRSITQIAYESGFADSAHFSRSFKETYGETPRDYRTARLHVGVT